MPRRGSAGPGPGPGARAGAAAPPTPAAEGSWGARRARAGEAFLCSFFLRLLGGSARAPAGGSRERPGHAGRGARGPGRPWGAGGGGREPGAGGAGCKGACEQGQARRGQGGGGARARCRRPRGCGAAGVTRGAGDSIVSGGSARRAGAGVPRTRHAGYPLRRARSDRSWRRPGASECLRAAGEGGVSAQTPHLGAPKSGLRRPLLRKPGVEGRPLPSRGLELGDPRKLLQKLSGSFRLCPGACPRDQGRPGVGEGRWGG